MAAVLRSDICKIIQDRIANKTTIARTIRMFNLTLRYVP